jgi:serpin B
MTESTDHDVARLAAAGNAFAFDLYGVLAKPAAEGGGNLFVSPYSVSTALAMTRAGARGETAREMAEVLHLDRLGDPSDDAVHQAAAALRDRLGSAGAGSGAGSRDEGTPLTLRVANALWGQEEVAFDPAYRELLAARYGARLEPVDFVRATEEARAAINRWAEEETEGRIRDLVPPGALDAMTRLVLTNAIYFKASWKHRFDEARTAEAPFHLAGGGPEGGPEGGQVLVPMMAQTDSFPYHRAEGYAAVELPYAGGETSMLIVVPDRPEPGSGSGSEPEPAGGFGAFERSFGADAFEALVEDLETVRVELALPRFEIASTAALGAALRELGMARAFGDEADFSGMVDVEKEPAIARDLRLDEVLHKAWVRVDEAGTEAAAATAAMMAVTSMPIGEPVRLIVDRPFLFFVRHRPTGAILFAGRVLDPTA